MTEETIEKLIIGEDEALTNHELSESDIICSKENNLEVFLLRTRITTGANCGFARGGQITYISNLDRDNTYEVTHRRYWQYRTQRGQRDNSYTISPQSRRSLGCSRTAGPPGSITSYTFMKWSDISGHRVKALKCHNEVRYDKRNRSKKGVHRGI